MAAELGRSLIRTGDPAKLRQWQALDRHGLQALSVLPHGLAREMAGDPPRSNKHLLLKQPVLLAYTPVENEDLDLWASQPVLRKAATDGSVWFLPADTPQLPLTEAVGKLFHHEVTEEQQVPALLHGRAHLLDATGSEADAEVTELPEAQPMSARVVQFLPNELVIEVEAPARGYAQVTQRWSRSWRAEVNGRPTPILGAGLLWRAVPVEAGTQRITFRYTPRVRDIGLVLSWGTLLVVGLWTLGHGVRNGLVG